MDIVGFAVIAAVWVVAAETWVRVHRLDAAGKRAAKA
jgi:hypothetical protein